MGRTLLRMWWLGARGAPDLKWHEANEEMGTCTINSEIGSTGKIIYVHYENGEVLALNEDGTIEPVRWTKETR